MPDGPFMSPFIVPIVVVPAVLFFILLIGPFRRPLQHWMHRKAEGPDSGALRDDVAEQAERLAEAERRIMELEERVDFTERLLASGDARREAQLPEGPVTPS